MKGVLGERMMVGDRDDFFFLFFLYEIWKDYDVK